MLSPMNGKKPKFEHLSTAEAADKLGVSVYTLNRWARTGKITPSLEGSGVTGARFYDRAVIEELAAAAKPKVSL